MSDHHDTLPVLPLRHGVVLPGRVTTIPVGRARSRALTDALTKGDHLLLAVQRDPALEDPALVDLHPIATLARVVDKTSRGARGVVLVVEPTARWTLRSLAQITPYWTARAEPASEVAADDEGDALVESLRDVLREAAPRERELLDALDRTRDAGLFADRVAGWLELADSEKAEVLVELDVGRRVRRVAELVTQARARSELRTKIDSEVRKEMGKAQREVMLRQQLRAIQKELGEGDAGQDKLSE